MPFLMVLLTACPITGRKQCGDPNAVNYTPDPQVNDPHVCVYPVGDPEIEFNLPAEGSQYSYGDTLPVDLFMKHSSDILSFRLDLIDYLTGDMLYDTIIPVGDTSFHFNEFVINQTAQYRELEFKLTLSDRDGLQHNYTHGQFIFHP